MRAGTIASSTRYVAAHTQAGPERADTTSGSAALDRCFQERRSAFRCLSVRCVGPTDHCRPRVTEPKRRRSEPIRLVFTLANCSECRVGQRLPQVVDRPRPNSSNRPVPLQWQFPKAKRSLSDMFRVTTSVPLRPRACQNALPPEIDETVSTRIAECQLRQAERQITAAPITKAQQAHTSVKGIVNLSRLGRKSGRKSMPQNE